MGCLARAGYIPLPEQHLDNEVCMYGAVACREDALAALDLYLQHCHFDPAGMEYQVGGGEERRENGVWKPPLTASS